MKDNININVDETSQQKKKLKTYRIATWALAGFGGASLVAAIAAPIIVAKNIERNTPEEEKPHDIVITQTDGWKVAGPTSAKKGDSVQFSVTKDQQTNTLETVPDIIEIGSMQVALTKSASDDNVWNTQKFEWPFTTKQTIKVHFKQDTVTTKTWAVIFDVNGGTVLSGNTLWTVADKTTVRDLPNCEAPEGKKSAGYEISYDGTQWSSFDQETDIITNNCYIRPVWVSTGEVKIGITFLVNTTGGESVPQGTQLQVEVDNGTTWSSITKPTITKTNCTIDYYYYFDENNNVKKIEDSTKLVFDNSTSISVHAHWVESTGQLKFELKDDKLSYQVDQTGKSYSVEPGVSLTDITTPAVSGSVDANNKNPCAYYPDGTWSKKENDGWVAIDGTEKITANTNLTLAPNYKSIDISQGGTITTNVVLSAGNGGTFGQEGPTEKVATFQDTITAPGQLVTHTWEEVLAQVGEVTVTPPRGYELDTENPWGIDVENTTYIGNVTLVAQYKAQEVNHYTIQLVSDAEVAWTGTQFFTMEYVGDAHHEDTLTIGDTGLIWAPRVTMSIGILQNPPVNQSDTLAVKGRTTVSFMLDNNFVHPTKENFSLTGWEYYTDNTGWKAFEGSTISDVYKTMYSTKLSQIADDDGVIKLRPVFTADDYQFKVFLLSNDAAIRYNGVPYVNVSSSVASASNIMQNYFTNGWTSTRENETKIPVYYTNAITGEKIKPTDYFTTDTVIMVHWADAAFESTTSLVKGLGWNSSITFGKELQCPWSSNNENEITIRSECKKVEDGTSDLDQMARTFGYEQADDLIGLERGVTIYTDDNWQNPQEWEHTVKVIGKQRDELAGEGTKPKAALTFEFDNLITYTQEQKLELNWHDQCEAVSYSGSKIASSDGQSPYGLIYLKNHLQQDLKDVIQAVKKTTGDMAASAVTSTQRLINKTETKELNLFLLSASEMGFGNLPYYTGQGYTGDVHEGDCYDYYDPVNENNNPKASKCAVGYDSDYSAGRYWLRSPTGYKTNYAAFTVTNGVLGWSLLCGTSLKTGIAPAFCI